MLMYVCMYVCVCVSERETEMETQRSGEREDGEKKRNNNRKRALNESPSDEPGFLRASGSINRGGQTLCDMHCTLVKKLRNNSEYYHFFLFDHSGCAFMT